ncbi:hypothetical protein BU26DRAFT_524477 [Trematosphaeria pertusa]|uniref:Uncharacterized protein n=1 Tax=Trematosphaeria pertusa TaxID=390896 RepID=A0A6A6HY85_9PLEO|nr:uncharacterized protein BU26DRAFT_524477 [Trematosphaeria pertusa]KAF2242330.1 hypothetical protein BU26DRAFT_524477 [Trematosphaeria pertusa]
MNARASESLGLVLCARGAGSSEIGDGEEATRRGVPLTKSQTLGGHVTTAPYRFQHSNASKLACLVLTQRMRRRQIQRAALAKKKVSPMFRGQ